MVQTVLLVFGTRPECIKMAPLVHTLRSQPDRFHVVVCITGQHREMLHSALRIFDIVPDVDLDIMKPGQDLFSITADILYKMKDVITAHNPDILLVHGDTTTTLAAATAGFYAGKRVGHVEAGLRTHDLSAPFPEEFNRQVVSKIAALNFAPTQESAQNLRNEHIAEEKIIVTGNTVIDALFWVLKKIESNPDYEKKIHQSLNDVLKFDWQNEKFILVTGHRRENFGDGFLHICRALKRIAQEEPETHIVFPVHLNPNVRAPVQEHLLDIPNIHLIEPQDYEPFICLMQASYLLLTDSGGIQEEAPSLSKPVLVMRDVTERPESVEAGTTRLVGSKEDIIVSETLLLLRDPKVYQIMQAAENPYGDGYACEKILEILDKTKP